MCFRSPGRSAPPRRTTSSAGSTAPSRGRRARRAADGHARRARHLDARASSRTSSPRRCRWRPSSRPAARARPAPAPTSCTPATSRRWRRPPTSAPRRRSTIGMPDAAAERSRAASTATRRGHGARAADDTMARKRVNDAVGLHPQPRAAARPQRRMGREGGARSGQPVGAARRSTQKVIDLIAGDVADLLRASSTAARCSTRRRRAQARTRADATVDDARARLAHPAARR